MPLSLSQLFEQHKSQSSTKPKKEEVEEIVKQECNVFEETRTEIDPEKVANIELSFANEKRRKRTRKRGRSSPQPAVNSADDDVHKITKIPRIKQKSPSDDTEHESDKVSEDEIVHTEYSGDETCEGEGEDLVIDKTCNRVFYENYAKSAKSFYNIQNVGSEQQSHSEILEVLHSALFPRKSKSELDSGMDRRLACDYDSEEEVDGPPSKSRRGRYRPRKRYSRPKASSGSTVINYQIETQEEVQDRVRRMDGYDENSKLRLRWKTRNVDFQSEDDIGDAFLERAHEHLDEKLRADEKMHRTKERSERKAEKKERRKKESEAMKELERNEFLEEDDEEKEQSQLLAQLSQNDPTPTVKEGHKGSTDSLTKSNPSSEKKNYWSEGYAMPKKTSIAYDFDPSVERMVRSGFNRALEAASKSVQENHLTNDNIKISYSSLMHKQYEHRSSSRFFFEPNRTLMSNDNISSRPGYRSGHIHQMLNMSSRFLCGGGGSGTNDEISLENRYLRLLCVRYEDSAMNHTFDSTICSNYRRNSFLTTFAEELGENMLLYLQNTWDDPAKVAEQFGLLNCFQKSPLRGNLLTNIGFHSKKKKSKMKELHKIRSIDWGYQNNNGVDSVEEDLQEEREIPTDDKILPDVTTSDGVVDTITIDTSMTIEKKPDFTSSKIDRDAFVSPNTLFIHIAGTIPPTPQFPLDPTAWLFGPIDRYSKFYHFGVKMDSSIYSIILSTLLKRIGRARLSKNESDLLNTQEQILNLIEEFADINENKFYLRYTNSIQDPLDSDIPLVDYYHGVTGYCNYMANGYLETSQSTSHLRLDELQQGSKMSLIAGKIWEFCRQRIRRNALIRFPKLRIVFGLALICRSLNPSASEILSRPIDDECTPLNLFKQTLEDMESKNYIAMNRNFDDGSIIAEELEFILHDAAEFFQEAVELDPTNIDYQLWHIGCLASCLLISSGNKVSDSVHAYPSQFKDTLIKCETVAHEVRPCLKKFKEVRVELSLAVQALLTLAKYQDSPKAHFAVVSMLEWGQVIGLLTGNRLDICLDDINRLHASHFGKWAQHEPATFFRKYNSIPENVCVTSMYAQVLENNPGDIKNWRNFVHCLGPFSETKNYDRWGQDRCWWGDSLLCIETMDVCDRGPKKAANLVGKDVLRQLRKAINDCSFSTSTMNISYEKSEKTNSDPNMVWLPTHESIMDQNDDESDISLAQRAMCYAKDLPQSKMNTSGNDRDHASAFLSAIQNSSVRNPFLQNLSSLIQEVHVYKIFIFYHLFGSNHPSMRKHIYRNLLCKCTYDENTETIVENCDEFRILVWLSMMGINIEDIIKNFDSSI